MDVIHLYNFHDHYELPSYDELFGFGNGINVSSRKITQEVVEKCHEKGFKIGVWVDAEVFRENIKFY